MFVLSNCILGSVKFVLLGITQPQVMYRLRMVLLVHDRVRERHID